MSALPAKRKPMKSGIERVPKREWPRHRAFIHRHQCSVPGCQAGPIECAHIRTAANSGKGIKPHDWFTVSLCDAHHAEAHEGEKSFERKYSINLMEIAEAFAKASPDIKMKAAKAEYEREMDRRLTWISGI